MNITNKQKAQLTNIDNKDDKHMVRNYYDFSEMSNELGIEKLCKAVCRRKADMKQHLKKNHDIQNPVKLETQLTYCKKELLLECLNMSTKPEASQEQQLKWPFFAPAMVVEPNNHSGCKSTITSSEIQTSATEPNNHSGCKSTVTSSEIQTSSTDLPPLVLPLIPETRLEVE
ncbi:unnamed protein product [Mytilus coruscus]|uniref:Uncharacterized protein n=1 Tax=Mytilus coruscus TaxID=42192 RepID=A0A6J8D1V3_MYTCO|nr:unnamed protein product [Mytilus coruscus]